MMIPEKESLQVEFKIRWQDDVLIISSPGGFVDGVTPENILTVEPKPRNPLLADAFKRIGLAERTGRGVDLIYQGLLRYGRPAPNYYRSDSSTVIVELNCGEADLEFLAMVLEEERRRSAPLPVDALLVLWSLRQCRRCDSAELAESLHKDVATIRAVIEPLVESGLVKAHGIKKGRTYTLGPSVYRKLGKAAEYVRQAGFDALQQEQMVLNLAEASHEIRRRDVIELCGLGPYQASRLLSALVKKGVLIRKGTGKSAIYERARNLRARS